MRAVARAGLLASLLGACTTLLVACGAADEARDVGDPASRGDPEVVAAQSDAIHHGSAATDPSVVALVVRRESCDAPAPLVNCTGTLIGERAVLTAAHCVEGPARGSYEVFFGASPGAADGSYRGIAGRVVDPRYQKQSDDHDIALVWLAAPAPVAPATLVAANAVDASWIGRTARAVGFGDAGDAGALAGEKLEGSVRVTTVTANTLSYGPAPGMTCRGDSGGPVFVEQDGTELVAAVTTSGDALCEQNGVAVRVDARLGDFIEPALAAGPPSDAASIAPETVCAAVCASDADCPADLACRADRDGTNRCQIPSIFAGDFGARCEKAADCGEGVSCVPLGDGCRCERACAGSELSNNAGSGPAPVRSPGRGASCRAAPSPAAPALLPLGFGVLATWLMRRRRAAQLELLRSSAGRAAVAHDEQRRGIRRN